MAEKQMVLSAFQLEVLGRVADDFESPETIVLDISRDLGRIVSVGEIQSSLNELIELGFVQAYRYVENENQYRVVKADDSVNRKTLWYMASPKGVAAYEKTAT